MILIKLVLPIPFPNMPIINKMESGKNKKTTIRHQLTTIDNIKTGGTCHRKPIKIWWRTKKNHWTNEPLHQILDPSGQNSCSIKGVCKFHFAYTVLQKDMIGHLASLLIQHGIFQLRRVRTWEGTLTKQINKQVSTDLTWSVHTEEGRGHWASHE